MPGPSVAHGQRKRGQPSNRANYSDTDSETSRVLREMDALREDSSDESASPDQTQSLIVVAADTVEASELSGVSVNRIAPLQRRLIAQSASLAATNRKRTRSDRSEVTAHVDPQPSSLSTDRGNNRSADQSEDNVCLFQASHWSYVLTAALALFSRRLWSTRSQSRPLEQGEGEREEDCELGSTLLTSWT